MKFSFLVVTVFAIFALTVADDHGKCGDDLTWDYTASDDTVTISGTGNMTDFAPGGLPDWQQYRPRKLVVQEGVTSIGNYAFCNTSLSEMTLPSTLKSIGDHAFQNCYFREIIIPEGVTYLGEYAFEHVYYAERVYIPSTVSDISDYAFCFCTRVKDLTISEGVQRIGVEAFRGIEDENIVLPSTITRIDNYAFGYVDRIYSLIFLGPSTISCGYGVFTFSMVYRVCTQSSFILNNVCGKSVSATNASSELINELTDQCHMAVCGGSMGLVQREYDYVTEWKEKTDNFVEYSCDDTAGLVHRSLCNSSENVTMMCYNDSCTEKAPYMGERWAVEVDTEFGDMINVSFSTIAYEAGVVNTTNVGIEMDAEGNVVRIILFADSKSEAENVKDKVDRIINYESCSFYFYNALCWGKETRVIPDKNYHSPTFDSGASTIHSCAFLVMLFFVAFLFF